eukprot:31292-Pelagococcus_subviridis.AAC.11
MSLRNGVHHADAVVWEPVRGEITTHLRGLSMHEQHPRRRARVEPSRLPALKIVHPQVNVPLRRVALVAVRESREASEVLRDRPLDPAGGSR